MSDGRPIRFLAVALGGWGAVRAAMLLSGGPLPMLAHALIPRAVASVLPQTASIAPPRRAAVRVGRPAPTRLVPPPMPARAAPAPLPQVMPVAPPRHDDGAITAPLRPTPIARGPSRLAGSAWLLARGGPAGTLSGGQLGASQAGLRVTYAIDSARRLALTARVSTPLKGVGKEAALGVEWKPTRLPFRLIAEQRFALDGGRGGPTVGIIGGYGPGTIAPGVRIEAYGQAGAIRRDGLETFVDTAARVTHPTATIGPAHLDLGFGAWGSAQRGAARFDLGPTAGLAVPVAHRTLRLSLDWRERLAGDARPGSGPAFSVGSDF